MRSINHAEPQLHEALGIAEAIREQSRQRFGRSKRSIESRK